MKIPGAAVLFRSLSTLGFVSCIGLMVTSTSLQAADVTVLELLPSPAAINSSLSRVITDAKGQVYLSWVTREDEWATLSYSKFEDGVWAAPKIISRGDNWFNNWADFPSLLVNNDTMAAHWLSMSAEGSYDYDIKAAFYDSENNGWGEGITIHKDGISAEHGFVAMLPMSEGHTFISWLDGRETRGGSEKAIGSNASPDMPGAMTLRAGIFDREGGTVSEWELDHRVCDCCQTSAALSATGPLVVYRDRSDEEIRDIYITRYIDDAWTEPTAIHNDGWEIAGCPVNGPAIAARDEQVAVSWFTAKDDIPRVQLVLSADNGESFSAPVLVASHSTNGRVGTTILESGDIVVSWMDTEGSDAKILLTRYSAEGLLQETTQVANSKASRRSGFPIIDSVANGVYVTWTDISNAPQVRVARVIYGKN